MVNPIDVDHLRLEIETMLREYPELADDEELRADMLEGLTNITEVLIAVNRRYAETKALAAGLHAYIAELLGPLEAREQRYEHRQEFLRDLIYRVMDSAQLKKIELPEVTLSLKANPPRLIGDADPELLPDDLCDIKRSINRKKIRAAIEAGKEVAGFVLSNAAPSLVVRVK